MVALVDCNNFYAACERLFNPGAIGHPVVVLSNNDGCVIARSEEAKELGIKMGSPAFLFREFFSRHNVHVFSSNYTLYGSLSNRVLKTLESFTPNIEVYSIDEAFLDLTNFSGKNLTTYATQIKKTIEQFVGIPVSIGIAPTKTLAKMANKLAKTARTGIGIHSVETPQEIKELLLHTEIGDIWGIGSQSKRKLLINGIKTAADFLELNVEWIRKNLTVTGLRILSELKGIPSIPWEDMPPKRKAICTARSFGKLLTRKEDISEAVANYANMCACKLRKEKSCAGLINVFLQTNTHRTGDKQYYRSLDIELPVASNSSLEIIHYAIKGFEAIYLQGYNYKKVGVMVMDIIPEERTQCGLFDNVNRSRDRRLMETFDNINYLHGKNMLRFASQGYHNQWKLKQEKLSRCYTTKLSEVYVINN